MRILAIALLLAVTVIAVAPGMEAEAHPCNYDPPVKTERCPWGGGRTYVCGKVILDFCIHGP